LIDNNFATAGKLVVVGAVNPNGLSQANSITQDTVTGKIVTAGAGQVATSSAYGFSVSRFSLTGELDTTFGPTGTSVVIFSSGSVAQDSQATGVAIQPTTGKIIAIGNILTSSAYFSGITRLNDNGTLDTNFGTSGSLITQFNSTTSFVQDIWMLADGSMYVAGGLGTGSGRNFFLAKVTANGALDTTFGTGGVVTTDFNSGTDNAFSIAVHPTTGSITLGGSSGNACALARYLSNGNLDTSFAGTGKIVNDVATNPDYLRKVVVDATGAVTAIGVRSPTGFERHLLLKYTAAGALDTTFGTSGVAGGYFGNSQELIQDAALVAGGKIVTTGYWAGTINTRAGIARYNADGSVDKSFGCNGSLISTYGPGTSAYGYAITATSGGGFMIAGKGTNASITQESTAVAAFINPTSPSQCAVADFDHDGISDVSVVRPNADGNGRMGIFRSMSTGAINPQFSNFVSYRQWGLTTDKAVPADYDGDARPDDAIYRSGTWWIFQSSVSNTRSVTFGLPDDIPVPADFDGDGIADISVFRPSDGTWWRQNSSNQQVVAVRWGQSGDVPVIGDFDGDFKADQAVFRPSNGAWYILQSSNGLGRGDAFGQNGDIPLGGDFNGDGKSDLAVFRPSTSSWYIAKSTGVPAQNFDATQFGVSTDVPVPADYDGDGKTDIAIFRNGVWWILKSSNGQAYAVNYGISTDKPVPSIYMQ